MTTLAANSNVTVFLPAGSLLKAFGQNGTAQVLSDITTKHEKFRNLRASEITIGPYSVDVSVLLVSSAAGITYSTVAPTDSGMLNSAQAAAITGALMSNAGTLTADALAWLRPRHRPILNPETYSAVSVTAATGVVASTEAAGANEFLRKDLVFTMAGVTTEGNTDIPFTADFYGAYPVAGFRIHLRVKCDDWTKVTALRVYLVKDKTTFTDRYQIGIIDTGISQNGMTDPAFSSAWNGVYRTIIITADQRTKNGSPAAWGSGGADPETFTLQAIRLRIATSAACVISINRIYSPKWPIGMYGMVGDGCYDSFRSQVLRPMAALGYRGMTDLYQTGESLGAPYPFAADLKAASDAGWDVSTHLRSLTNAAAFAGTESAAEIALSVGSLQRKINDDDVARRGLRVAQFLTNTGKSNVGAGIYMAQELQKFGIQITRGECVDSQWGINPFNATYTGRLTGYKPVASRISGTNNLSSLVGYCQGWVPERGRYNLTVADWFAADATYNVASATQRDTYSGSVHSTIVDKVALYADACFGYTHQVMPYDGTNPTAFDSGTNFWAAMKADLLAKVAAGKLLLLSMTQYASITYWRADDIYLRWDGEWCNRVDDSIAF